MGREQLAVDDRRGQILTLVRSTDFVRVEDLRRRFGVSTVTVRSDLDALADQGKVRRVHGGAMLGPRHYPESPYESRLGSYPTEKAAIAEAAVDLLASNETVILDVGTTTMAIAQAIAVRSELENLTVFTNGLNIALALEPAIPRVQVMVTGGALRPLQHSLIDPMAQLLLDRIQATTAFIGCNGIQADHGITSTNLPETAMKQRILRSAHRRVIVADASKFSQRALARVCDFDDLHLILTAGEVDPAVLAEIRGTGAKVQLADERPDDPAHPDQSARPTAPPKSR